MKAIILAGSLLLPRSFHCVASAQLTKVTLGNNAISGNGLLAWMAIESGIFRKNGLEVQDRSGGRDKSTGKIPRLAG